MADHSFDSCLQLVADRHRRRIIYYLRSETSGTTTFEELVDWLYSSDADSENDSLRDREQVAIRLHHTHLPELADSGVVEFDYRTGILRYHPDEQVERVLDSLLREASLPSARAEVFARTRREGRDRFDSQ